MRGTFWGALGGGMVTPSRSEAGSIRSGGDAGSRAPGREGASGMKSLWWRKEAAAVAGAEPAALAQDDDKGRRALNPYLDGRRGWNSHVDRAYAAHHTWQLIGVAGLLVRLAVDAGITYVGIKIKFMLYRIDAKALEEAVA